MNNTIGVGLVKKKKQDAETQTPIQRLFFQSVHTLSQMFLDGKPKTCDPLYCCCKTYAKCQLTIPLHTPTPTLTLKLSSI